jgi:hypothetical protein
MAIAKFRHLTIGACSQADLLMEIEGLPENQACTGAVRPAQGKVLYADDRKSRVL